MSEHLRRRDQISTFWFIFGLLELPWIGINHIAFNWCAYESQYRYLVDPIAILAYSISVLFVIIGCLTGYELWKNVTVPAVFSMAWGVINFIYSMWVGYFLFSDRQSIIEWLIVFLISMCYSLSYLYAGWVGLFHVRPKQPVSANESALSSSVNRD